MGRTFPLSFRSHDGLLIHGYLTIPPGAAPKGLPMVVLPGSGLFFTRASLTYSWLVQFLANRGYAVLKINPRGTPGYGKAFFEAGRREVGRGILSDLTEGVRWAIGRGVADPHRLAIVGDDFGGCTAALALEKTPDLYRCAVSSDAICDWLAYQKVFETGTGVFQKSGADANSELTAYISDRVGDTVKDAGMLREISPYYHVDQLRAPILLVSHKVDGENLQDQTGLFEGALKARGAAYEKKVFPVGRSNLEFLNQRIEYLNLLEDFLARNMK
jgi:dipeptidyl aminopeptidase/acylaminoacyl peptidase